MKAAWVVIAIACTIMVEYAAGGDNCCNGNKILDTILRVVAYGGHKRHNSHYHNGRFTAFTAYLGSHLTANQNKQKIVFDKVLTNYGNAYNSKNGVFTCPTDGVYSFDNNYLSTSGKSGHTKFALNGHVLAIKSFAHSVSGINATASMSVVLQLKKGDRVWVVTYKGYTFYRKYTTFSGWLLHEI